MKSLTCDRRTMGDAHKGVCKHVIRLTLYIVKTCSSLDSGGMSVESG